MRLPSSSGLSLAALIVCGAVAALGCSTSSDDGEEVMEGGRAAVTGGRTALPAQDVECGLEEFTYPQEAYRLKLVEAAGKLRVQGELYRGFVPSGFSAYCALEHEALRWRVTVDAEVASVARRGEGVRLTLARESAGTYYVERSTYLTSCELESDKGDGRVSLAGMTLMPNRDGGLDLEVEGLRLLDRGSIPRDLETSYEQRDGVSAPAVFGRICYPLTAADGVNSTSPRFGTLLSALRDRAE